MRKGSYRTSVFLPELSDKLAEMIGILIGDGGMTKYQVTVTLGIDADSTYAPFVVQLMQSLFRIQPSVHIREARGCIVIILSSVVHVELLCQLGLKIGNKLKQGLDIPQWVKDDKEFYVACLRGIFDTDGCVYQEVHKRKSGVYRYTRLSFVSASPILRHAILMLLGDLGIRAKIRGNRSVNIERFTDIEEYFRIVGSNNPKHIRRYVTFGGVG